MNSTYFKVAIMIGITLLVGCSPVDASPANDQDIELLEAAKAGDLEKVQLAIENGKNIDKADEDGLTVLHWAIANGHPEVAELLIREGADVHRRDIANHTALHWAAAARQLVVATLLIEKGIVINVKTRLGMTALHIASFNGDSHMAKLLATHGADLEAADMNGLTPLHAAASWGRMGVTDVLIKHGAQLTAMNPIGLTPLFFAAAGPGLLVSLSVTEIAASMESALIEPEGVTQPIGSPEEEYAKIVQRFLDEGIDPNAPASNGITPLHLAAQFGGMGPARVLLANGANADAATDFGETPLHYAAAFGQVGIVDVLISNGASIDATSRFGLTPLAVAAQRGNTAVIQVLRHHGAQELGAGDAAGQSAQWSAMVEVMTAGCVESVLASARADFAKAALNADDTTSRFPEEQARQSITDLCGCIIKRATTTWSFEEFMEHQQEYVEMLLREAFQGGECKFTGLMSGAIEAGKPTN